MVANFRNIVGALGGLLTQTQSGGEVAEILTQVANVFTDDDPTQPLRPQAINTLQPSALVPVGSQNGVGSTVDPQMMERAAAGAQFEQTADEMRQRHVDQETKKKRRRKMNVGNLTARNRAAKRLTAFTKIAEDHLAMMKCLAPKSCPTRRRK